MSLYKKISSFLLLVCITAFSPLRSQDAASGAAVDLFVIHDVEQSATGRTSTDARAAAVDSAVAEAFTLLVKRLVAEENRAFVGVPGKAALQGLLTGFEVEDEKSAAGRYSARFHVAFDDVLVRSFLKAKKVPFVMRGVGAAVLHFAWIGENGVELAQGEDGASLARAANWRNRIGNYVLPEGNLGDRLVMPADRILAMDMDGALDHAASQGASRALIVLARPVVDDATGLDAVAYSYLLAPEGLEGRYVIRRLPDEDPGNMKVRALSRALDRVDMSLLAELEVSQGDAGILEILLDTRSMAALGKFRALVANLPTVENYQTVSIGLPESRIRLEFTGRRSQLLRAMEQSGFRVWYERDAGYRAQLETLIGEGASR